jgi:hypothetical protein
MAVRRGALPNHSHRARINSEGICQNLDFLFAAYEKRGDG